MMTIKFLDSEGDYEGVECVHFKVVSGADGTTRVEYTAPDGSMRTRSVEKKAFVENAMGKTIAVVGPRN